ncbi:MAG: HD-GYP domain-containing protein [Acidimicrobiales bacterium]
MNLSDALGTVGPGDATALLIPTLALAAVGAAGAAAGVPPETIVRLGGLAVVVGGSLLLDVPVPWGGVLPIGYALLIALAQPLTKSEYAAVVAVALLLAAPSLARRRGAEPAGRHLLHWGSSAAAGLAATKLAAAALPVVGAAGVGPDKSLRVLAQLVAGGAAFVVCDLVGRRLPGRGHRLRTRAAWPVYASLMCAAALVGLAARHGIWMAAIAATPLVMVRFSFQRYADARRTYRQTITALSIVPEVAGLSQLGHAERTAAYAEGLARMLNLAPDAADRVVTASRLHHIGSLSLEDPDADVLLASWALARKGGDILRETGFLAPVGDLVEQAARGSHGHGQEAAVVRIASHFDDLVGNDPGRWNMALRIISHRNRDPAALPVVAALRRLMVEAPASVAEAIAAAAPISKAKAPESVVELAYQG